MKPETQSTAFDNDQDSGMDQEMICMKECVKEEIPHTNFDGIISEQSAVSSAKRKSIRSKRLTTKLSIKTAKIESEETEQYVEILKHECLYSK